MQNARVVDIVQTEVLAINHPSGENGAVYAGVDGAFLLNETKLPFQ